MFQLARFPVERAEAPAAPRGKDGVVYTRPWVVDLILDLVGYHPDRPLADLFLVEPSCGEGSFLLAAVARLADACARQERAIGDAEGAIVAYELDPVAADVARASVSRSLMALGVNSADAARLADGWVRKGDYLLDTGELTGRADFIVGNPPYIRLEDMADGGALYRSAYPTMVGRADLYVAFHEAALRHLKPGGSCGFICADRWMLNEYGAALRRLVTARHAVDVVVQMHHAEAFETEVSAYPAVTIVRKGVQGAVVVATLGPEAGRRGAADLAGLLGAVGATGKTSRAPGVVASRLDGWFSGAEPWPLIEPDRLALLRRLERGFPTLEETGARVGIGVATGADKVFITRDPDLVEPDRLLPLAMAADVKGGTVAHSGHYLVNPWNGDGLVDLLRSPRLAAYFAAHGDTLRNRHVGRKNPSGWYRTIDRVDASLLTREKLYLPDFKGRIAPVLDCGDTYPHHNLYFISGEAWDLRVLGGLLLSDVAQFFIESYGVRMRGGYLRFQAQYLRHLRVPRPRDLAQEQSDALVEAFLARDVAAANRLAEEIYGLTAEEREALGS